MNAVVVAVLVALALRPRGGAARSARASGRAWPRAVDAARRRLAFGSGHPDEVTALPELLELTARSRRAGLALLPSLGRASESVPGAGMGPLLARLEAGSTLADALGEWAAGLCRPEAELVAAVLLLGDESGAAVAARLDATASTLRQRAALVDEVRALTAQTRASALVVGLAPLAFAVLVALTDDRFLATMFGTAIGRMCLAAGLVLDAAGFWWMRHLTRIVA